MELRFYNTKEAEKFDDTLFSSEDPSFITYLPNLESIKEVSLKYADKEHILVIAHGGSITSFYATYHALRRDATKIAHFLWTVDPERITELKKTLTPANTVVVAISKSGQTLTQLESLSQFIDFPVVVVSEPGSPLHKMAMQMSWDFLAHPAIGGRFSGFTEATLLPMQLCDLDLQSYLVGGHQLHSLYKSENLAQKLATTFYKLEKQGFVDVLGLVYSSGLSFSQNLIMQLCHETFGKNEKGQTYTITEGPEVQHHTLQRFLGGTKNMIGLFVNLHASQSKLETSFPPALHSIAVRSTPLFDIQKLDLHEVVNIELNATLESAKNKGLPLAHLELTSTDPRSVGQWVAFWQLFAVYSGLLRGVNPFDQPEVEIGKTLSLKARLDKKQIPS